VIPLKAVIFDFGGVLMRTASNEQRMIWEARLGLRPGEAAEVVFGGVTGAAAQLGRISTVSHWEAVRQRLCLNEADLARFRSDFFTADTLDEALLAHIDRLRPHFHLGLLSNAMDDIRPMFEQLGLLDHFDSVTISAEEHVAKPDPAIFRIALARAGATPDRTLFVDDFAVNIEAAHALGMHTIRFTDAAAARRQLAEMTGIE
jgi:putative hydrolase of the HAD superfamily